MLDEIIESIEFLSYAAILGDITDLHEEYLKAFYEKMDAESSRSRPMIPRKKTSSIHTIHEPQIFSDGWREQRH